MNVIETYFELSAEERERFRRLVAKKEYRKVQDVELTWGDRLRKEGLEQGLEEGIEKGIEKGVVQGKRETLERQLTAKFGPLPDKIRDRIEALSSTDELDAYLDRVLTAATLEDIGLGD